MLVYGHDRELCAWASLGLFGVADAFDEKAVAIGVIRNDRLVAAVIYNNYVSNISIEMSIYSVDKKWATRYNLKQLFSYPFTQLGLRRVTALCSATNEGVIMFLKKLGFQLEGNHRMAHHDGGDALSFGMLSTECKWIKGSTKSDQNGLIL